MTALPAPTPRPHFHPHDRLGIGFDTPYGIHYRCLEMTPAGYQLQRIDQPDLVETFTLEAMAKAMASAGWRYQAKFFDPVRSRTLLNASVDAFAFIPRDELPKILWKHEWARRFLTKEAAGLTNRSDRSMRAIIPTIAKEIEDQARSAAKRAGDPVGLEAPPSARTLRTWVKLLENGGHDPTALRHRYRECGSSTPGLPAEVELLMAKHAARFADERRPTKVALHRNLCDEIEAINKTRKTDGLPVLPTPCLATFRERVASLPAFDVYAGRFGQEAARRKFYMITTGLNVTRPGERVEMDEWEISLQALLIDNGVWSKLTRTQRLEVERGRFWLSVAQDVATRCFLGLRLLPKSNKEAKAPSTGLAIDSLKMAVSDKTRFASAVGAVTPWYMRCGIETVVTDQGSAYISHAFTKTATAMGTFVDHPPARLPQLRAHVERSFGTLRTRLIGMFTGQTFANVGDRGDYPAEKRASLTLEELCWAIVRYVVDAYHNTPHAGLGGKTPREAWDHLTKLYGVVPPPDRDTVRNAFGVVPAPRRLDQRGIRFLNLDYQSKELQAYRRMVGDCLLEIIVDPDDIGWISVRLGDEGWLTVPCMHAGFAGICAQDWIDTTRDLKRRIAGNPQRVITDAVARKALRDIQSMAESAVRRANIGATTLSAEELDRAETSLSIAWSTPDDPSAELDETNPDLFGDVITPAHRAGEATPDADAENDADPEDEWSRE